MSKKRIAQNAAADIDEILLENIAKAKKVQVDGMVVENKDLSDIIAADKYLRQRQQEQSGKLPLRFVKMEPRY